MEILWKSKYMTNMLDAKLCELRDLRACVRGLCDY